MKVTKALCALVAATTLALAPISSSPTPTQTVFAATHSQGNCIPFGNGWCRYPDGYIEREGRPDGLYNQTWRGWFLDLFNHIKKFFSSWFR
ncbi:TPA: hypothetical protein TU170_000124 [Streptococcus equi subsp. zooepidemicus]|uniref:hypothetical protein n=1 Tax=Streptococcus equi TaxID=1336 RepID=UPI0013F5BBAE|nr:hypothetical protein [Streptococcus equi]MDI5953551.1 hypothetical protein [Streptococcus equi subsp. zooepidemicus]QTZ58676.1 hypothetical protein MCPGFBBE_00777 [Streptococcus equi subsp. zooepidemicus]QUF63237.1 hypothetical protein KCL43_04065 [Streptococcus equi subsp. zooepidemicus]QWN61835.1 hypothetical protein GJ622_03815 [Streptococcus equi subsp. zooepidemicus]HEL0792146.1 hypothetical protein [Streptococcus equi subsp. zooepidemicus]